MDATAVHDALLDAIAEAVAIEKERAGRPRHPQFSDRVGYDCARLVQLAEAYAWVVAPVSAHGA
jgi:hypothetical protein